MVYQKIASRLVRHFTLKVMSIFFLLTLAGCAHLGPAAPRVRLLNQAPRDFMYLPLGRVSAEGRDERAADASLSTEAAKLGADAVIVEHRRFAPGLVELNGLAIRYNEGYVPPEATSNTIQ